MRLGVRAPGRDIGLVERQREAASPRDLLEAPAPGEQEADVAVVERYGARTGGRDEPFAWLVGRDPVGDHPAAALLPRVLLDGVGERPPDSAVTEVGVHLQVHPADHAVVRLPLVHGARHDPAVDARAPQHLRLVRIVPIGQQLGRRVRDLRGAVSGYLGRVPRLDAVGEVLPALTVESVGDVQLFDREIGHRAQPWPTDRSSTVPSAASVKACPSPSMKTSTETLYVRLRYFDDQFMNSGSFCL